MLEIVRSPARVTWLVQLNGITLEVCQTKSQAKVVLESYKKLAF